MAALTGTTQSFGIGTAGGVREDLEDVIWDLFPDETYFLTNLDKVSASNTYHEWLTDSLAAPTANRQVEGDDASFSSYTHASRVGNYQQISRKTFIISGTTEAVTKAGRKREAARQAMKQMRELKNDMEYAIVRNQGSSAQASTTARSTASMESWLATNEILATTIAAGFTTVGFSNGVVATPTDGNTSTSVGALTVGAINSALEAAWSAGGQVSQIVLTPAYKQIVDGFTGIATRFVDNGRTQSATIINAASVYVSSFGTHTLRMHRHARSHVVLLIDPEYWAISFLRRPFSESLAKTGDAEKRMILAEWGVVCRNEKASAKIVGISATGA
jgi:hypothetical protein